MKKKAVSFMWGAIAGAVLVLVVIAVVIWVFGGETGKVKEQISKCELRGGVCQKTACSDGVEIMRGCTYNKTYNKTYYCCVK